MNILHPLIPLCRKLVDAFTGKQELHVISHNNSLFENLTLVDSFNRVICLNFEFSTSLE